MNKFKQNLYRTACLLMVNIGLYSDAHADLGTYNFTLKGNATTATCGVDETQANKLVELGTIATRQLKKAGDKGPRVAIPFNLMQCPVGSTVTVTFIGEPITDKQFLALTDANATTTAKHVAIEITDAGRNQVPISRSNRFPNDPSNKSRPIPVGATGNVSTVFYANYIATDMDATAGTANAYAEFWIEYQ